MQETPQTSSSDDPLSLFKQQLIRRCQFKVKCVAPPLASAKRTNNNDLRTHLDPVHKQIK